MSDIQNGLVRINKSPIILLFKLLTSTILLDIMAIIILIIDYIDKASNGHTGFSIGEYFFGLVLILQLLLIILIFVKWLSEYHVFEKNKITYFSGIIFKSKQEFILDKIGCISFEQGILGKIFQYGDVVIYIQNEKFILRGVANPSYFIGLLGVFKINKD